MSQESCNLNKEEATSPPSSPSQTSLCINPPQEFSSQKPEKVESFIKVSCKLKAKKVPTKPLAQFGTNRCSCCSKKVGLVGFRCRCGGLFCSGHRFSDMHDCSFDYKAFGREEISKANPLIRAAKIIKI